MHVRKQIHALNPRQKEVMGLAVTKAEPAGCNNSDHVTILQILKAGSSKGKAMDL